MTDAQLRELQQTIVFAVLLVQYPPTVRGPNNVSILLKLAADIVKEFTTQGE